MRRLFLWVAPQLTATLLALPCSADWLVTKEGARVETAGPWKVKGNQVVFTLPNGTLSSLRASEIDLDASAVATAQAKVPAPAPAAESDEKKERPKPVLVVTDKDVRRANETPATGSEAPPVVGGEAAVSTPPGEEASSAVEVVGWQTRDSSEGDGLELYGTLRNNGTTIASSVELVVELRDAEGKPVLDSAAFLDSQTLGPGKSTTFRALLPGLTSITGEPQFKVKSNEITLTPAKPLPEGEEDEPGSG